MKRVLLLLAVLAFALPAFADSIRAGSLSANGKGTALSGSLSNVVFNSSTGSSTATFNGNDTSPYISGAYTRPLKIASGGNFSGDYYTYGTVGGGNIGMNTPEPGTFGLLGTGLVIVSGLVRRRLK